MLIIRQTRITQLIPPYVSPWPTSTAVINTISFQSFARTLETFCVVETTCNIQLHMFFFIRTRRKRSAVKHISVDAEYATIYHGNPATLYNFTKLYIRFNNYLSTKMNPILRCLWIFVPDTVIYSITIKWKMWPDKLGHCKINTWLKSVSFSSVNGVNRHWLSMKFIYLFLYLLDVHNSFQHKLRHYYKF